LGSVKQLSPPGAPVVPESVAVPPASLGGVPPPDDIPAFGGSQPSWQSSTTAGGRVSLLEHPAVATHKTPASHVSRRDMAKV
jgi:hypothetical protein